MRRGEQVPQERGQRGKGEPVPLRTIGSWHLAGIDHIYIEVDPKAGGNASDRRERAPHDFRRIGFVDVAAGGYRYVALAQLGQILIEGPNANNGDIFLAYVRSKTIELNQTRVASPGHEREIFAGRGANCARISWMPEIAVSIQEDQSVTSATSQSKGIAEENTAVATQHDGQVRTIDQRPDAVRQSA